MVYKGNYIFPCSLFTFLISQEKLMSQSAWKDYSSNGHHTNYAYETFDPNTAAAAAAAGAASAPPPPSSTTTSDKRRQGGYSRGGGPPQMHPPMPPGPSGGQYSLPRGSSANGSSGYSSAPYGYGSYDRRTGHHHGQPASYSARPDYAPPDHYFMPSQRKYSGENIRVYVDYNK